MSDKPVLHSEVLANTEYDGNRRARAAQPAEAAPTEEKPKLEHVADAGEATGVASDK